MRISGTYIDRLLVNVLPFTLFGCVIVYFVKRHDSYSIKHGLYFYFVVLITLLFWALDSLVIYLKKIKTLRIGEELYFNKIAISPAEVVQITPVVDKRAKWSFKVIEFKVWYQNAVTSFLVLEKPVTIIDDLKGKKSKTLVRLFEQFPELEEKLCQTRVT